MNKRKGYECKYNHHHKNTFDLLKIPLTILLRENTEIGLENLYVDTEGKNTAATV